MSYNRSTAEQAVVCLPRGRHPCLDLHLPAAPTSPLTSYSWPAARSGARPRRTARSSVSGLPGCCTNAPTWDTRKLASAWACRDARCGAGASAGRQVISPWTTLRAGAARRLFPPLEHALVKAVACELVAQTKRPLSRQSLADITGRSRAALGKPISRSTVWRILDTDALKPWRYKYWIFPRDPQFAAKAGPILDLYAGFWQGQPLGPRDFILSADEKTSIQARARCHPSLAPGPGRAARVEHEYERGGALQYLAAWDVRRGCVLGRCEAKTGIAPFGRLVEQVLSQEPYHSGERFFWVVDNGSSHRGQASVRRLRQLDARITLVHTPLHASWLNQVEIYFSIVQRKALTPNDFADLAAVRLRLALYEELCNRTPTPFRWKFTREQLTALLTRLEARQKLLASNATTEVA
jgi:hypothetical protein